MNINLFEILILLAWRKLLLAVLLVAPCTLIHAQSKSNEQMGGVYYAYHSLSKYNTDSVPDGWHAVYISHFGRHGSRWLPDDARYVWVLSQFEDQKNLTFLGKAVRKSLLSVWRNAKGNGGQLTPLGERQHEQIAQRMYESYPTVFSDDAKIRVRSSIVNRCVSSMRAFTWKLKTLNPTLDIECRNDSADMKWIAFTTEEERKLENNTHIAPACSPDRLMKSLFRDISKVKRQQDLMIELHTIASDMQDVELHINLYKIFTRAEMQAIYEANNRRMWMCNGLSEYNKGIPELSAVTLWRNIEICADSALVFCNVKADLRFGHDTSLYRLLALFHASVLHTASSFTPDCMDDIIPMGANLQIVFYRNDSNKTFVRLYLNEKRIYLPAVNREEEIPDGEIGWNELKKYCNDEIARLN